MKRSDSSSTQKASWVASCVAQRVATLPCAVWAASLAEIAPFLEICVICGWTGAQFRGQSALIGWPGLVPETGSVRLHPTMFLRQDVARADRTNCAGNHLEAIGAKALSGATGTLIRAPWFSRSHRGPRSHCVEATQLQSFLWLALAANSGSLLAWRNPKRLERVT